MAEFVVKVPDDLKPGLKELSEEEIGSIFSRALRERLSEKLMFRLADDLLKDSEVTDELALKWASELKEKVARRHGIQGA